MSKNIGKSLREQHEAKFENNPVTVPNQDAQQSIPLNDYYSRQSGAEKAGRSFNQEGMFESPFASDHFNSKLLGFDLGPVMESQNERKGYTDVFNSNIDFDALRAENQSAFTKIGGLATQFTGKTAVGVVGNIIGSVYGLGEWALTDEGSVSSIFDNKVTRSLDDVSASIEAKNTVFVNPKDGIGFNFNTAKGITDAFAFIASAAISEGIMQTVGNMAGGAGAISLTGRMARYSKQLGRLGKVLRGLDKAEDIEKLALRLGKTVDEMSELKRIADFTAASTGFARRALTTTGYEAGLEARQAKDQLVADMTENMEYYIKNSGMSQQQAEQYRVSKMKEIGEAADAAGLTTFTLNTALLGASNAIQFPTIFGSSYLKKQTLGSLVRKGLGTVGKKEGKKAALSRTLSMFGRILKNPATEFMEETGQGVFSNFSQNQFEVMMGDRTHEGILAPQANTIADSAYKAVVETYGTQQGLNEGIIGAIVGAIGIPGLKKHGKGYKLQMHGGIAESVRDERSRREDIETAMESLNSMKMSEIMNHNKRKATQAAVDGQKEDLALVTGNKVEAESLRDNKIFRYTVDRMEKGMDDFISKDVSEMEDLASNNLEKYKQLFNKDETFTQEDALKEVDDFKKKVDVYKQAYQTVHKRYNLNLLRGDNVTKKLTDTLTYAVATEKINTDRLDHLKKNVFKMLHGKLNSVGNEFTQEEIDNFTHTSGKLAKGKHVIDNYVARKQAEKNMSPLTASEKNRRNKIMDSIDPDQKYLLYRSDKQIENELRQIDESDLNEKEKKAKKKSIRNVQKARKEFSEFTESVKNRKRYNPEKSYKVAEMEEDLDALAKEVNAEIRRNTSESLQKISRPIEGITRSELRDYLRTKKDMVDGISEKYQSMGVLELTQQEHDSVKEMIDEIHEITDRLTTAVNVASYLYGFKDNPGEAYARVVEAQFSADMDNARRLSTYLDLMTQDEPSDEFRSMFAEYKEIIEGMGEELDEATKYFSKESVSGIRRQFNVMKNKIKKYNEFLNITEDLKAQEEEATANAREEATSDDIENDEFENMIKKGKLAKDETEGENETAGNGEDVENEDQDQETGSAKTKKPKIARDKKQNRLSLRENSSFTKYKPEFQKMLNNGEFKNKAATTMKVMEDVLSPDVNPGLHKVLLQEPAIAQANEDRYRALVEAETGLPELTKSERAELITNINNIHKQKIADIKAGDYNSNDTSAYDAYNKGLEKIKKDPKLLNSKFEEMDPDVFMFLRYAPVQLDIYDKQLSAEDDYKFEITEEDKSVYDQYLFAGDDILKSHEYDTLMEGRMIEELEDLYQQEKTLLKDKENAKNDTKSRIKAEFKKKRMDVEARYKASANNAYSNLNFRQLLLKKAMKGENAENLLKLKIHNVDQGDFQVFNFSKAEPVEERSVEELGFTTDNMSVDDIYYSNQKGEYIRIDGKKTDEMDNHPFADMKTGLNGKVFFKYKNKAGKEVPIKMNTSKLQMEHIKVIYKVVEDFLKADDKLNYRVDNSGIGFLDRKGLNLEEFLEFFLRSKSNYKGKHVIYLNNTFKLNMPKDDPSASTVRFYAGEATPIELKSVEQLQDEGFKKQFFEQLANTRFTINKRFILNEDRDGNKEINKEVLDYYIKNKIINHPFNTAKNFDNIYAPGYNKGLVFSLNDTPDTPWEPVRNYYDKDIKNLRTKLAGGNTYNKKNKYGEPDLKIITHSIMNRVMSSMRAQARHIPADAELTAKDLKEMARKGLENVIDARIEEIMEVAKNHPHKYDSTQDHKTNFKITPEDSEIDKYLKTMYAIQADLLENKEFMKQAAMEYETSGGKSRLLSAFADFDRKSTRRFHINKYKKREENLITTQLSSEEQFNSIMDMAGVLETLTEMEKYGKGYIYINYSDDYINNKGKPNVYRAEEQSRDKSQRTVNQYRTRLTSVKVEGNPRWDATNKRVVGGSILLNLRDWKDNKEGGKQVYLLADETMEPHERLKINMLTSINLPYMEVDFSINWDALGQEMELIEKRRRANKRNIDLMMVNTKKALGIKTTEDLFTLKNDKNTVTDAEMDKWDATDDDEFDAALAKGNVLDTSETQEETPDADKGMSSDLDRYIDGSETSKEFMSFTDFGLTLYDPESNDIDEEQRQNIKANYESNYDIDSGEKLFQVLTKMKEAGNDVNMTKAQKFAEFIFNTTIDCN